MLTFGDGANNAELGVLVCAVSAMSLSLLLSIIRSAHLLHFIIGWLLLAFLTVERVTDVRQRKRSADCANGSDAPTYANGDETWACVCGNEARVRVSDGL